MLMKNSIIIFTTLHTNFLESTTLTVHITSLVKGNINEHCEKFCVNFNINKHALRL